ncbi:MAG: CPBP family intramembrane metalloprotease [Flavobacteriales bacterium]|nr:CPBP family intramembrane metalloprotease [Flavobacteriales bacterium]
MSRQPALLRIAVFFGIALVCSWYFRIHGPTWYTALTLPAGLTSLKHLLEGVGPLLGALVVLTLFQPPGRVTLFGSSRRWSLLMAVVPVVLFAMVGVDDPAGQQDSHVHGAIIGMVSMGYVLFEEFGWRGYLLDEVRGMGIGGIWVRALIVGLLWYAWHLTPFSAASIGEHMVFLGLLIFGSWGFERITDTTGSVISVACFHLLGSLVSTNALIQNGMSGTNRLIVFGICLVIWITMVSKWPGRLSGETTKQ